SRVWSSDVCSSDYACTRSIRSRPSRRSRPIRRGPRRRLRHTRQTPLPPVPRNRLAPERRDDMPRGGARTVSGPPPDPNALRRDRPSDAAGWVILPAEGRPGDPPEWPLLWQTQREYDLWKREWG